MLTASVRRKADQAAARGIELMDTYSPGWHKKVNVDDLEMSNPTHCLLGQTFGDYFDGIRDMANVAVQKIVKASGLKLDAEDYCPNLDAEYYGFESVTGCVRDEDQYYSRLAEHWRNAVTTRKLEDRAKRSKAARKAFAKKQAVKSTTRRARRSGK